MCTAIERTNNHDEAAGAHQKKHHSTSLALTSPARVLSTARDPWTTPLLSHRSPSAACTGLRGRVEQWRDVGCQSIATQTHGHLSAPSAGHCRATVYNVIQYSVCNIRPNTSVVLQHPVHASHNCAVIQNHMGVAHNHREIIQIIKKSHRIIWGVVHYHTQNAHNEHGSFSNI